MMMLSYGCRDCASQGHSGNKIEATAFGYSRVRVF
jgi:hypothetical protein